ncbi:histone-lysine N-methyltransferase 2B-like isoform X3 [Micropterus salmoides]|uniref:histone-lysine N-methyltransferase 2B-like isoform X3 n=1 Tax=Micropterus salmoides TaxID=27706 RepID=UPI0018ED1ED4|nr:histone-lysine N-methyltransferase 2B-like isoform X3 [Micropterus salmoides]
MGKGKRATVYWAAVVILVCYLVHMIDCYRLKKTQRQHGQKKADAAKTVAVQEGKIVFGRVFKNGSAIGSRVLKADASMEGGAVYQADSAGSLSGWPKGQSPDLGFREAAWRRMAASLQCGGDQLKFRAVGPGVSQFTVDQGTAPPMLLSQVPSSCGYSMQRNSLALVMLVPYDGCNVVKEGGSYVLPMHWQGVPVSLWCPTTATPQPVPTYTPSNPETLQTTTEKPVTAQSPPYPAFFPPFYPFPPAPPTTTAAPTTTTPANPTWPQYPQYVKYPPLVPPFYPFPPAPPTTTAAPTTTTPANPTWPQYVKYPPLFPPFYPFPPAPTTTAAPTTTTAKPAWHQFPQYAKYPLFFPHPPPNRNSCTNYNC